MLVPQKKTKGQIISADEYNLLLDYVRSLKIIGSDTVQAQHTSRGTVISTQQKKRPNKQELPEGTCMGDILYWHYDDEGSEDGYWDIISACEVEEGSVLVMGANGIPHWEPTDEC